MAQLAEQVEEDFVSEEPNSNVLFQECRMKLGQILNEQIPNPWCVQDMSAFLRYHCPECPMTFKTHHQYYDHKRIAHSSDERLVCKYCGKRFASVTNARLHELTHEKPQFQCRFCAKLIKTQDRLEAHERYHTGERPYPCNMCTAAFTSKGRLMQHQKGVHKMAGPRGGTTGWVRQKKNK